MNSKSPSVCSNEISPSYEPVSKYFESGENLTLLQSSWCNLNDCNVRPADMSYNKIQPSSWPKMFETMSRL